MKKTLVFIITMALFISIFAGFSASAGADSIVNAIKGGSSQSVSVSANAPNADFLKYYGGGNIQLPMLSSYFPEYRYLYINAPKGHSVYTYTQPDKLSGTVKNLAFAYHGSTFIALAEENGYVCGIFQTDQNQYCAAWVDSKNLLDYFPGEYILVNSPDSSKNYYYNIGEVKWSLTPFVGTNTKYPEIIYNESTPKMLDGIGIEYQVISRNGKVNVLGARDVYINDGQGWEYVTSFDLKDNDCPVRVTVHFDTPRQIKAVATVPQDRSIEGFIFRQSCPELIFSY